MSTIVLPLARWADTPGEFGTWQSDYGCMSWCSDAQREAHQRLYFTPRLAAGWSGTRSSDVAVRLSDS